MKFKQLTLLGITALVAFSEPTFAQTNTNTSVNFPITIPGAISIFTSLPDTTPDLATVGISAGLITLRASPENYAKVDYNFGPATNFLTRFQVSGEIYNAPESTGVDAAALYAGYRAMVSQNYELTLSGFGRRNWATVNSGLIKPSWSGGGQLTADWRTLSGNNLFTEAAVGVESPTAYNGRWSQYLKAGVKLYFGTHF